MLIPGGLTAADRSPETQRGNAVLAGHLGSIDELAVSPDGKLLFSSSGKERRLWDIRTREPRWKAGGFDCTLCEPLSFPGAVFSPDSRWIALSPGGYDIDPRSPPEEPRFFMTVELRDAPTGRVAISIPLATDDGWALARIAFAPDSTLLALAPATGAPPAPPEIWHLPTRARRARLEWKPRVPDWLRFSPDGKLLIGVASDWKRWREGDAECYGGTGEEWAIVWDPHTGRQSATVHGGKSWRSAALSPDAKRLAASDGWSKVWLYEIPSGKLLREIKRVERDFIGFTADGKSLVTSCYAGSSHVTVRTADVGTGRVQETISFKNRTKRAIKRPVVFSAAAALMAVLEEDGNVEVFETLTGRKLATFRAVGGSPSSAAFFPDGRRLAVGQSNGVVSIWDVPHGLPSKSSPAANGVETGIVPEGLGKGAE
jgi:WD40 repeat protein